MIAERTGHDRKTVRKYIQQGLVLPKYKPRPPKAVLLAPYLELSWPQLTGARLLREIREQGYKGGNTILNDYLRQIRPAPVPGFEVRFETPAGLQAQVDFAKFKVRFAGDVHERKALRCLCDLMGKRQYLLRL